MKGNRKTRRRKSPKTPGETVASDSLSSQATGNADPVPSSTSPPPTGAEQVELRDTELVTQRKTSEVDSPCSPVRTQSSRWGADASRPRAVGKRRVKEPAQTRAPLGAPTRQKAREDTAAPTAKRSRPGGELETLASSSQDESLLPSPDTSIELSHREQQPPSLSFEEDEGSEEEEEFPSFLMQVDKEPSSITGGVFVWHKLRKHPFWPALVKSVNRKHNKASIMFIEDLCMNKKGFTVALKSLKPFDCEEADELRCKAKEKYNAAMEWSWELIKDYRIRIACGSFSGSFIEYFAHDMSYPVRRTYPQAASERLTITSDPMVEALGGGHQEVGSRERHQEVGSREVHQEVGSRERHQEVGSRERHQEVGRRSQRLLPDRSQAAHNRANEKLVHFIVKQRMADERLLAVIRGQQQSRWLGSFLSASRRRVVNVYLEDEQQLDQVYRYLEQLYGAAGGRAPLLAGLRSLEERVPLVLDVLLPEAIISAMAGVDGVTLQQAEEKYLRGRVLSHRERQEFDLTMERQMRSRWTSCLLPERLTH